jgi:hypothetical protein
MCIETVDPARVDAQDISTSAHRGPIEALLYRRSANKGLVLITASERGELRAWRAGRLEALRWPHAAGVVGLAPAPASDSELLSLGVDGVLYRWSAELEPRERVVLEGPATALASSSRFVAVAHAGQLSLLDPFALEHRSVDLASNERPISALGLDPRHRFILISSSERVWALSLATGLELGSVELHASSDQLVVDGRGRGWVVSDERQLWTVDVVWGDDASTRLVRHGTDTRAGGPSGDALEWCLGWGAMWRDPQPTALVLDEVGGARVFDDVLPRCGLWDPSLRAAIGPAGVGEIDEPVAIATRTGVVVETSLIDSDAELDWHPELDYETLPACPAPVELSPAPVGSKLAVRVDEGAMQSAWIWDWASGSRDHRTWREHSELFAYSREAGTCYRYDAPALELGGWSSGGELAVLTTSSWIRHGVSRTSRRARVIEVEGRVATWTRLLGIESHLRSLSFDPAPDRGGIAISYRYDTGETEMGRRQLVKIYAEAGALYSKDAKRLRKLPEHGRALWSASGRWLLMDVDGTVTAVEADEPAVIRRLPCVDVTKLAVSDADGGRVACLDQDAQLHFVALTHDRETLSPEATWVPTQGIPTALRGLDDHRFVLGYEDGSIELWSSSGASQMPLERWPGPSSASSYGSFAIRDLALPAAWPGALLVADARGLFLRRSDGAILRLDDCMRMPARIGRWARQEMPSQAVVSWHPERDAPACRVATSREHDLVELWRGGTRVEAETLEPVLADFLAGEPC